MKEKMKKEHQCESEKNIDLKLNARNITLAINSHEVTAVQYSIGNLKWTEDELEDLGRKSKEAPNNV